MRSTLVLLLALATGCNTLLGIHDPDRTGGPVTGTWQDDRVTLVGTAPEAMDLSTWDISAYVADPAQPGGFTVVPATITGPGTFGFPDLPASYLVRIQPRDGTGVPQFFQATSRTIDLGQEAIGRAGLDDTMLSTSLAFDISGPTPYWSSDAITLYSLGANTTAGIGSPPGLTPHKGFRGNVRWFSGYYSPPPKLLAGDDLWVIHSRPSTDNGPTPIFEVARFDAVTLTDGLTVPIAGGTFIRTPEPMRIPVTIGADYRAALGRAANVNPYDNSNLTVYASAGHGTSGPTYGPWTGLSLSVPGPGLYAAYNYAPAAGDLHPAIWLANPFPADWQPVVVDTYQITERLVLVPGTIGWAGLGSAVASVRPLGSTITLGPMISAPRNIQINGAAGDQVIGLAPAVVRWDPVEGASYYQVTMQRIEREHMTIQTWLVNVAELRTAEPSVTIPGELLDADQRYAFRVAAVVDDAGYRDGMLRRSSRPYGVASAVSGIALASHTCGNGKVDPGEECDTDGPSAVCDFDCTSPMCGDGVLNTAAGEVCDAKISDPPCRGDCKGPLVCGDGIWDPPYEACDDGNRIDGDGCSISCQIENLCGNGRIDVGAQYEQCDDGNQVNDDGCSNTCMFPHCGDGLIQAGNGEACDDGNGISGDGCDSSCQIEPAPTASSPQGTSP
ncbi:MAG TPA: DUF4215 domain-containing protein [Kofleriaceae bacterium]|jgi:cysteine-rich repeat protein|nr:DUF4215 domain-containing protein [Kofleriaceae bacterium]